MKTVMHMWDPSAMQDAINIVQKHHSRINFAKSVKYSLSFYTYVVYNHILRVSRMNGVLIKGTVKR